MLGYALRSVKERRTLWAPAVALALLAALPGTLLSTVLAPSAAALLLSADLQVAAALLPVPLDASHAFAWGAIAAAALLLGAAWVRVYLLLVWCSDDGRDAGLGAAWRGTKGSWGRAAVMYAEAHALVVAIVLALFGFVALAAPPELALLLAFGALLAAAAARAAVRVVLTLALRAAILGGRSHRAAWSSGRRLLQERRREAVAAWIALAAFGVAVWMGGRLVTPVLQDTALSYGHLDPATFLREGAQLAFAVPLEALLLALSAGIWTAVYLGGEALRDSGRRDEGDLSAAPALAALAVLVLVVNGTATVVDRAEIAERARRRAVLVEDEIRPAAARRATMPSGTPDYEVEATLEGDGLRWRTTLRWHNDTGERVDDIALHVYPNAFTRELDNLPLADDVLQTPAARRTARPGTLEVVEVLVDGSPPPSFELDDTALTIPLRPPAPPGRTVAVEVALAAKLPRFPERFGTWRDVTLLGNWVPVVARRDDAGWRLDPYGSVGDPFVSETSHYRVSLTMPAIYEPVGSGTLVDIEADGDERRTWHFEAEEARDVAYAVSLLWRGRETIVEGTTVRAWYPADRSLEGAKLLEAAASAAADYIRRFGSLPFREVDVVQTSGLLGGMEYPGTVFVADPRNALQGFPLLPELLDHAGFNDAALRYIVGHELAHQWWYASVGNDQVREPWLDEGLAEVSTRMWLEATEGGRQTWVMTNLTTEARPTPDVLSAAASDYADNLRYTREVYLGGSEVLMRLRARVGAPTFDEILRRWHARGRGRIATVDEFLETIEEVAGPGARRFLERYR